MSTFSLYFNNQAISIHLTLVNIAQFFTCISLEKHFKGKKLENVWLHEIIACRELLLQAKWNTNYEWNETMCLLVAGMSGKKSTE